MKRLWVAVAMLVLLAPAAAASSVGWGSLNWGDACWGDAGAASNLTWACDSDTYTGIRMTCSFDLGQGMPALLGAEFYLVGMTETTSVPDWWKLGDAISGDCRANLISLTAEKSFSSACVSPWQGEQLGGIASYFWDAGSVGRMSLCGAWVMADPVAVDAGVEYFAFQIRISAAKTVGGCAGCSVPVVWSLNRLLIDRLEESPLVLESPFSGGNQSLTWQSSTSTPVPVRNATWGQIKSLYR